jgi:hypothetical protein
VFGSGSRGLRLATSSVCCRVAKPRSGYIGRERAHVSSFQLKLEARIAELEAAGYLFVPAFHGCCTSKFICPFLHFDGICAGFPWVLHLQVHLPLSSL